MRRYLTYIFAALFLFVYVNESYAQSSHHGKKSHRQISSYAARYTTAADSAYLDALHTGQPYLVWCTYYGKSTHGRRTASGEIHDMNDYVCAHLILPFGTKVKLRNPKNGKEIIVKVNDRGPHSRKYKFDLSYGAARELDFLRAGIIQLEMTVLGK